MFFEYYYLRNAPIPNHCQSWGVVVDVHQMNIEMQIAAGQFEKIGLLALETEHKCIQQRACIIIPMLCH